MTVIAEEAAIIVEAAILNRRLEDMTEQLTTLNRMKDEFVSTVSHEFKTPLTTILGFLTVMLEGDTGPLNVQQMKFLAIVKAASKRLSGLVSDLLDLSRLEGGAKMELVPFDLGRLVLESVENYQPIAAEEDKTLSSEATGGCPRRSATNAGYSWFSTISCPTRSSSPVPAAECACASRTRGSS